MPHALFDHAAPSYDKTFTNTKVGRFQRNLVWRFLDRKIDSGNLNILEINAGTGEDAVYMAQKGHYVLATDISPRMVEIAAEKTMAHSLDHLISTRVLGFHNIEELPDEKFDIVFSNFGGLNCLGPDSMKKLAIDVNNKLKPGGRFIAVIMSKDCWWEYVYYSYRGDHKTAKRRSNSPVKVVVEGLESNVWYYDPREFEQLMSPDLTRTALHPVGCFIPPSYLNDFFKSKMTLLRMFSTLDRLVFGVSFFSRYSDHYLVELQKQRQG